MNLETTPIAETTGYWELVDKAYEDEAITKEELRAILLQQQSEQDAPEKKKSQRVPTILPWKNNC